MDRLGCGTGGRLPERMGCTQVARALRNYAASEPGDGACGHLLVEMPGCNIEE